MVTRDTPTLRNKIGMMAFLAVVFSLAALIPAPVTAASVKGWATHYAYVEGQAAAGPALRRALGSDWRGSTVYVTQGGDTIKVVLTDWCACGDRHGTDTVIDLDKRDFAKLASLGTGVISVTVSTTGSGSGPQPTLPPTDTATPYQWREHR